VAADDGACGDYLGEFLVGGFGGVFGEGFVGEGEGVGEGPGLGDRYAVEAEKLRLRGSGRGTLEGFFGSLGGLV